MPEVCLTTDAELRALDRRDSNEHNYMLCETCGVRPGLDFYGCFWLCAPCREDAERAMKREVYGT
jgi:hypothetical protein